MISHENKWWYVTGVLAAYNVYCTKKHKIPFSQFVRKLFRTNTIEGKISLVLAWSTITALVLPHWMKVVTDLSEEIIEELGGSNE